MKESGEPAPDNNHPSGNSEEATVVHHNAAAPQKTKISKRTINCAKALWSFLFGRPIGYLIKRLDDHNGVLTAAATIAIAVLTYFLASDSSRQATISGNQLNVMQGQLDEMKTERRPWVYPDKVVVSGDTFFDSNRLMIPITVTVKNTGQTPAIDVIPITKMYEQGQRNFVNPFDCISLIGQGIPLFPGQSFEYKTYATFAPAHFDKDDTRGIWPSIAGCVRYRPPDSTDFHSTGFAFQVFIGEISPKVDYRMYFNVPSIPANQVLLQVIPSGWYAD